MSKVLVVVRQIIKRCEEVGLGFVVPPDADVTGERRLWYKGKCDGMCAALHIIEQVCEEEGIVENMAVTADAAQAMLKGVIREKEGG